MQFAKSTPVNAAASDASGWPVQGWRTDGHQEWSGITYTHQHGSGHFPLIYNGSQVCKHAAGILWGAPSLYSH